MSSRLAPAKINLYLHLHGKRADGYHLLDSLVGFTNFGDQIEVRESDSLSLQIEGPFAEGLSASDNLIMRAAHALQQEAQCAKGAAITLHKALPVAAGLGGGSADAAATLHALNDLWGTEVSYPQLLDIAQDLGADVPACVMSQTIYMSGIGHTLDTAPHIPALPVLLINPNVPLSTAAVYEATTLPQKPLARPELPSDHADECVKALKDCRNDLEPAARQLCPELSIVLDALTQSGATLVRMCGSGATCMGIYPSLQHAKSAKQHIAQTQKKWWLQATTICG